MAVKSTKEAMQLAILQAHIETGGYIDTAKRRVF